MNRENVKLADVLEQVKIVVQIESSKEYKLVTVSNSGIIKQREIVKGFEIKGERAFEAQNGMFIYSRLSVHNGAFGIVPQDLEGALLTSEMPIFKISDKILPKFLIYSLQLQSFKFQLEQLTKGVGRTRVKESNFLNLKIYLPSIEDQNSIVNNISKVEQNSDWISNELNYQWLLVKKLRQQLLQDAVQGKLVSQDTNDEPASELLKHIKAEKSKLLTEKKIKTEKDLPPIKPEEIPFDIPEGWVWCRLRDVCLKITDGTHFSPPNIEKGQYKYITAKNIKDSGIDLTKISYVTKEVHQEIFARCNPEFGDILYIKDGATTGIVTINNLREEFSMLSSVALLKLSPHINNRYLMHLMRSPFYYNFTREDMSGVAITRVTLEKIQKAIFPLPPSLEQSRIVQKLDELMQNCNELEDSIKQSEVQNKKLLQQVLREALSKN